ncbi:MULTISPECIES: hypothetical protein [Enterococcus]|uniref:hypothetical protein n=1 Tax=Enterococcus TaxID=1350 RepID=UPI00069FCB0D|nr:hypothetical protein [Enterococcus durans]AKZ47317.1 hypothetical protein LIU_01805 [Enterococcus durans]NEX85382.1 hypothetical protein [Enterococcus durans]RXE75676.1 hypothetical protein EIA52_12180 [Enterococcus durans]
MKFEQAVYINGEESRTIQLRDIILEKNFETIIENLYCPYGGCNAQLVYNRRADGNNYLSKRIGVSHIEGCEYESGTIPVKSVTFFLDENGRLSDKGISRRKTDAMKALDDFIDPPKELPRKATKPRPIRQKKGGNESGDAKIEEKIARRIKYDPNAPIIDVDSEDDVSIYEPPFLQRNLNQISTKDAYKNLKTSAKLKKIVVNENENRAKIYGSLLNQQVIFELTPDFFTDTRRRIAATQLMEYLQILNKYITSKDVALYLTTLCQSHEINIEKLSLFIYEPDFMSFQFIRGSRFKRLSDIVVAINTKAI